MVSHYVIMEYSVLHPRSDSRNWPRSSEWMWDLIVSVPDHCLSFYFTTAVYIMAAMYTTFSNFINGRRIYARLMCIYPAHFCMISWPEKICCCFFPFIRGFSTRLNILSFNNSHDHDQNVLSYFLSPEKIHSPPGVYSQDRLCSDESHST